MLLTKVTEWEDQSQLFIYFNEDTIQTEGEQNGIVEVEVGSSDNVTLNI